MTRSDILNAVRDGECSKAFGEKCMEMADRVNGLQQGQRDAALEGIVIGPEVAA